MSPNWAQGKNYTLKGEEFIQFLFIKSETEDSCRFEIKMRQNAPNPISISIFRGWGLCPRPPGGEEGKGQGEGKGRGRRRREGKGRGSLRHCRWGIDAPVKRCSCLTSVVCLSRTSGLTREQTHRKTKIGIEVADVTRDADTTFKIKRSKVKFTRPLNSVRP